MVSEEGVHAVPNQTARMASLGYEADLLRSGSEASDLSFLASSTSLLMRGLAKRGSADGMSGLVDTAQKLLATLKDIREGQGKQERDLPYRQLVPVRIWKRASEQAPEFAAFADGLPDLLGRALSGEFDKTKLIEAAQQLEIAATLLREQSAQTLNSLMS